MTCCWCASQWTLNKGSRYNCVVERLTALHRRHLREHLSEAFTLFWFTIQKVFFPSVFAHRPPSTTCHFLWRAMKLEKKKKDTYLWTYAKINPISQGPFSSWQHPNRISGLTPLPQAFAVTPSPRNVVTRWQLRHSKLSGPWCGEEQKKKVKSCTRCFTSYLFDFFSKCRSKQSTWLERYSTPGLMGLKARLSMMCSRHAAQRMRLARRLNDSRWRRRDRGLYAGREHLVTWGFFSRIWEEPSAHPRPFCLRDLLGGFSQTQRPYRRESSRAYSKDSVVVFISKCPVRLKWSKITCYVCHGSDMTCRLGLENWRFPICLAVTAIDGPAETSPPTAPSGLHVGHNVQPSSQQAASSKQPMWGERHRVTQWRDVI